MTQIELNLKKQQLFLKSSGGGHLPPASYGLADATPTASSNLDKFIRSIVSHPLFRQTINNVLTTTGLPSATSEVPSCFSTRQSQNVQVELEAHSRPHFTSPAN